MVDQRQIAESLLATMYNSVVEAQNNVQRLAQSSASADFLEFAESEAQSMWSMYCGAASFWRSLCEASANPD